VWSSNLFLGSDDEDQPITGSLAGKTIKIDSVLSANVNFPIAGLAELFYDGNMIFAGQIIPTYNPSLLQVKFFGFFAESGIPVKFYYSFIDAAGFVDPTPAFYSIHYPVTGGPLPIILSDFSALKNNCKAVLNWNTSSEINSDKFEIEFSKNSTNHFEVLSTILASGNSTNFKSYQFSYSMESGVAYFFRLKMINKDGTYTFSEIRKLSCSGIKNEIIVSPNPTADVFHITGMNSGINSISIFGKAGQLISTHSAINNKNIDISNLQIGVYLLKIVNENGTSSVLRLVKY
jgi:Secretion system C-terminal sorting domain